MTESDNNPLTTGDEEYAFEAAASFAQQRLWFLAQLDPDSAAYNINFAIRLKGKLDLPALQKALDLVVARHESLRTTFDTVDEEPVQVIAEELTIPFEIHTAENTADERNQLTQLAALPFDLIKGPLLRPHIIQRGENEQVLLLVIHHAIADAWSLQILYSELSTAYTAFIKGTDAQLPELPIQYADYAEWQQEWLSGEQLDKQLGYWTNLLGNSAPRLDLPTDKPRPRVQTSNGANASIELDAKLTEGLRSLAQKGSTTLFNAALTLFEILLARYSGSNEIVVGTPVAGRKRPELQNLIGFFVNTIALHSELDDDPTFGEFLGRIKADSISALANDELPFEKLVEELRPERDTSYSPIFQVMFVLHHGGSGEASFGDLTAEGVVVDSGTAKFDLTLFVTESDDNISLLFEYNTDLFEAVTIERMLSHYETLLRSVIANPDARLSELHLLDESERTKVVEEFNATETDSTTVCIHELVEAQVEKTPDAVALEFGNVTLTYRELNNRANQLARHLRTRGAERGSKVVISMERSVELPIAALAVIKTGACYVPVDPHYPEERIQAMLEDTDAEIILTQDLEKFDFSGLSDNLGIGDPKDPVYCIYTSGSTGKPKGVELSHAGLCNLLNWQNQDERLQTPARTLQFASFSFDVHFQEFFGTWSNGGTTVMVDEDLRQDLPRLADFIAANNIERLYLPYAAFQPIAENLIHKGNNGCLKDVIVAGEQLQVSPVIRKLFGLLDKAALHNQYGPSEAHVVTALTLTGNPDSWPVLPTIGRPIANTRCYVLDQDGTPCPVGIPGELYLGGVQVGIGYLNRPELNLEKFYPSPFIKGDRLYRTGDRVRFMSNGEIEFLGRADDQLKWRGFRIEPGEIETRLTDQHEVQHAIVMLREDIPGDKRLVAYVTGDNPDETALKQALKDTLPEYMVPGMIVVLDELPLTPSGKVARRLLPAPEYSRDDNQPYVAPRNETEEKLATLWGEILGISRMGIHDDFFQLGGHSLLATRLIARIRAEFETEVPLIDLFSNPSVAEFAAVVDSDTKATRLPPIKRRNTTTPAPLSFAQQRLWFLDQLEPGNPVYNFPIVLDLKGQLNIKALQAALDDLINRHEALRTSFESSGNTAVQVVSPVATVELQQLDCKKMDAAELRREIDRLVQQGFDLNRAPLMYAHLLIKSENEHTLVLVTHHIVSDGWSLNILMRDLSLFYAVHNSGKQYQPDALAVQYSDFAEWQRNWFSGDELQRQLDYWRNELQDAPPVIDLPTDRPRPAEQSFNGNSLLHYLPAEVQTGLEKLASENDCTLFMVILAVFDLLLSRYSGEQEIVIGTPIAGRRLSELEELIGFFSNTLAIRADLSGDPSFHEFLARTRESTLNAYAHQDLPFEKLVEELQPERDMSHSPVFQVMLVIQNDETVQPEFGDLDVSYSEFEMGIAKFDLLMEVATSTNGMRTGLQFNTDLFDTTTVARMLSQYETLLRAVVANPNARLSELSLLDDIERQRVVHDFNTTDADFEAMCVHRMVEQQVERSPAAVAVELGIDSLTYTELNDRANLLGAQLRELGAQAGSIVAVSLERTLELPVALLGVLKSGACYVPVDPNYPDERIQTMLEDAQPVAVLTSSSVELPAYADKRVDLDKIDFSGSHINLDGGDIADPLYCIYTSGSTGKPKGVQLSHAGLGNLLNWQNRHERLGVPARTLQFASFSFDVHFQEFFGTWVQGGTTVMVDEDLRQDLPALAGFIDEHKIERLFLPYAALQPIAETLVANKTKPALRDIVVAGEQLQVSPAVRALFGLLDQAALHNQYGPSEAHVVTALTLTGDEQDWPALPSIGTPVANTRCYVLDSAGEPCPVGIPGELYIGGIQVGIGYLNRPELNMEKFSDSPFVAGERLYQTGDRVRFLTNGAIEFLGRADDQLKWRGFRIEPGEIEAQLTNQATVQQAIVMVREDSPGDRRLVGYVTGDNPDESQLKQALKEALPDYMVPQVIVVLDELPLTPSGKVARRRLPVPEYSRDDSQPYEAPRNDTEATLTGLWGDVLNLDKVGIHDDFFALGGHSLLATQLVSRVRDHFGISLPLKYIFRYPSPAELADMMTTLLETQNVNDPSDDEDVEEFSF